MNTKTQQEEQTSQPINPSLSAAQKGALIGGVSLPLIYTALARVRSTRGTLGGALGDTINHNPTLFGATSALAIGAGGGAGIGYLMDKNEKKASMFPGISDKDWAELSAMRAADRASTQSMSVEQHTESKRNLRGNQVKALLGASTGGYLGHNAFGPIGGGIGAIAGLAASLPFTREVSPESARKVYLDTFKNHPEFKSLPKEDQADLLEHHSFYGPKNKEASAMSLEDRVLAKLASHFSDEDVKAVIVSSEQSLGQDKLASEEAVSLALRDSVLQKLAHSFTDEELQSIIAQTEQENTNEESEKSEGMSQEISPELAQQLAAGLGPEKVAQIVRQVEAEKEAEKVAAYHYELGQIMGQGIFDKLAYSEKPVETTKGTYVAGALDPLSLGVWRAARGEESAYKPSILGNSAFTGGLTALSTLKATGDPRLALGAGAVGAGLAVPFSAAAHAVGRGIGHVGRGVYKTLNPDEPEKVAAYHYELGQIIGQGYLDKVAAGSQLMLGPGTGPATLLERATEPVLRNLKKAPGATPYVAGAAGLTAAGLALHHVLKKKPAEEQSKSAAEHDVQLALEVLARNGVDINKLF